jgi:hypothetical protein
MLRVHLNMATTNESLQNKVSKQHRVNISLDPLHPSIQQIVHSFPTRYNLANFQGSYTVSNQVIKELVAEDTQPGLLPDPYY